MALRRCFVIAAAVLTLSLTRAQGAEPVVKPEQIVANHLNSIGTEQARAGAKTRVAQGTAQFRILTGGAGTLEGKAVLVSEGRKFQYLTKFANNDYRGERIIFDGEKVSVAFATPRQKRSIFGEFVLVQDAPIREGLLGGVLSTSWPLLNLDDRKAKISYEGIKKIDGKELINLRYKPNKSSDLDINLYFEPDTYHHVRTVYTRSQHAGIAQPLSHDPSTPGGDTAETLSARQSEIRYRLEERFSDFATSDGLTLPTHYVLHYTQELQNGQTDLWEWEVAEKDLSNNMSLDPRNFEIK